VLFLDAIYLPVRPSGPQEGVICAWGITETGARALVSVRLGMREAREDWLEVGRDLTSRGLAAPRLVVADGAPGLISAIEEIRPRADRRHCAVHRLRNLRAKLPKSEQDRIRFNYWSALTDATSVKDGKLRLQVLISELEHRGYEAAAKRKREALEAEDAADLGLITFAPDDIDWDEEIRIATEERASFSPDALTGLEANYRFVGPETMETKIFGRLSAWQNWIFNRPNAAGPDGALRRFGTGQRAVFDRKRV